MLRFLHEVPRIGSLILGSVLYPCLFDFERDIPHTTKEEAEKGLLEIVIDTLRGCPGVDVNTIDAGGQTPLIYAAVHAAVSFPGPKSTVCGAGEPSTERSL